MADDTFILNAPWIANTAWSAVHVGGKNYFFLPAWIEEAADGKHKLHRLDHLPKELQHVLNSKRGFGSIKSDMVSLTECQKILDTLSVEINGLTMKDARFEPLRQDILGLQRKIEGAIIAADDLIKDKR